MKISTPFNVPSESQLGNAQGQVDVSMLNRVINNITSILRNHHTVLVGKVSLTDNIQGYYQQITIAPPYGHVSLPWKYTNPPNAVLIANIQWDSSTTPLTTTIQPSWHLDNASGFIIIDDWIGLNKSGKGKYQITLKVE